MLGGHKSHVSGLVYFIPAGLNPIFSCLSSTKLQQFTVKSLCPSPICHGP